MTGGKNLISQRFRNYPFDAICKEHSPASIAGITRSRNGRCESERSRGGLFLARADEHLIQTRFPAARRVAMNDSPLGRFVDRRDQRADLSCIRLLGRTGSLIHRADAGECAAIAKRSFRGLAGTFSGRFCVGHFRKFTGRGDSRCEVRLSRCCRSESRRPARQFRRAECSARLPRSCSEELAGLCETNARMSSKSPRSHPAFQRRLSVA
jgi:hypothetical protein